MIKMAKEETEEKKEEATEEVTEQQTPDVEGEESKHIVAPVAEEEIVKEKPAFSFDVAAWKPKTEAGKKVKTGEITDVDQILNSDKRLLEVEIVDMLLPTLDSDLLLIGQSKGKFGGGQRRVFKQTQKKTKEGNKPSFATCAVVGDRNGHVGVGYGKSRETVPAREKAIRRAKLNLIKIRRGCGSWQCSCKEHHSIPFEVEGKCGSVKVKLMPAPKGTGLCAGSEIAKILQLAGVEDVWSKTVGKTTSRINLTAAVVEALKMLMEFKVQEKYKEGLNLSE
jgi:small subunit ribosomal protein S5